MAAVAEDKDALLGDIRNTKRKQNKCLRWSALAVVLLIIIVAAAVTIYFVLTEEESQSESITDFFTINQPTSIYIDNGGNFVLHVDYCNFALFEQDTNITLMNLNTRCYCWNYSESTGIHVVPSIHNTYFNWNDYHCDIPGPTLYITNNMTFNITMINNMEGASHISDRHETRLWPDVTNLHTHGLHIDPLWDNVFIAINPGQTTVYQYKVPLDHYPGTHWYHPHIHGSTNYQLHGGMFGALIVEEIENDDTREDIKEMIPIIMHFHYYYFYTDPYCDCNDKTEEDLFNEYTLISSAAGPFQITSLCYDWCMMPFDIRNQSGFQYFGASDIADPDTGLLDIMLLNGEYEPNINLQSNKWYKLQMINANGMFYTQLNFKSILNETNLCNVHLLGNDGIFFNKSRNLRDAPYHNQMIIGPGSRADVAIKCQYLSNFSQPIAIRYSSDFLGDAGIPRYTNINDTIFSIQIHENILNEDKKKEINQFNSSELPYYEITEYPEYLRVEQDALITEICPCYTYPINGNDPQCEWSFIGTIINGQSFNLSKPLLYVCSDKMYEFEVSGVHPVHIHNTPFQIQRDLPSDSIDFNGFMAQRGDWRDTIGTNDGNFNIRYPTGHFNGAIIIHCHFLPHEDDGMLAYFQIIDCHQSPQCDA